MNWMPNRNTLLRDGLKLYLMRISAFKKGHEQEKYRVSVILKSALADVLVCDLTSVHIASYRDTRLSSVNPRTSAAIAPATVRLELSLLSNFMDIARIEWGICDTNPCTNVRKPKSGPARDRRLRPSEERKIIHYCTERNKSELLALTMLAVETAMRLSELLGLTWENINLRSRVAHLPDTKNGTKRDVPLTIKARSIILAQGPKPTGRVIRYTAAGLKSAWRTMNLRLDIQGLHFHDLRHEAVTRLFELGTMDVMEIAAISGHKSLAMLKRYTHLKAARLVPKLDKARSKAKQAILNHLVPYPALFHRADNLFYISLCDLDIEVNGSCFDSTVSLAESALLRDLIIRLRDGLPLQRQPDEAIGYEAKGDLLMINPLP